MIDYATDPEWRAFLRAVLAHPADDLPRLVAADWLEEGGERDRAEFIRVQCELAGSHGSCDKCGGNSMDYGGFTRQCRGLRCRLKEREYMVSRKWIAGEWAGWMRWHRGFVYEVRCTLADWMDYGQIIVREHPIVRVNITDREPLCRIHEYFDGRADAMAWYWCDIER